MLGNAGDGSRASGTVEEEHRAEAGRVARRQHVGDTAVLPLEAGREARGAVEVTVDADRGPERLDELREDGRCRVRVQRGKCTATTRVRPASRGAPCRASSIESASRRASRSTYLSSGPLVPHLASRHRGACGVVHSREPATTSRPPSPPNCGGSRDGTVWVEQPPELAPPSHPTSSRGCRGAAPSSPGRGIEPRQVLRHLGGLGRPGDVARDDDASSAGATFRSHRLASGSGCRSIRSGPWPCSRVDGRCVSPMAKRAPWTSLAP